MDEPKLLGDKVEELLQKVNADKLAAILEKATGKPCGCKKRKEFLNGLHKKMQDAKNKILIEQMNNARKK